MTYMRSSDDEDAPEDLDLPSANEELLRYIATRDSSVADSGRIYLVRADASFLGTDFP